MPPAAFLRNTEHAPLCVTAKGQTRLVPHQGGLWALGALRALGSTISNPAPGPASKTHTAAASRGSPSPGRGRDPRELAKSYDVGIATISRLSLRPAFSKSFNFATKLDDAAPCCWRPCTSRELSQRAEHPHNGWIFSRPINRASFLDLLYGIENT